MKGTGIVRKVDSLNRVVIPKELCRMYGITEGDALEFFTEDKGIYIQKYCPFSEEDLGKVMRIVSSLMERYAIFDPNGKIEAAKGEDFPRKDYEHYGFEAGYTSRTVTKNGAIVAIITVLDEDASTLMKILKTFEILL